MMDRNYPTSSFADQLAPPAQTAAWAYERSTANIKPSSTYGATPSESELLQRQTYTSNHQPATYTTVHHPTGLSGVFDASSHPASSSTSEASVMNFLSAVEPRSAQAGPAAASLLPQFRTASWQTGVNSSAATELFVSGALPSGSIPTPYQHHNTFSSRGFSTASSLALQDAAFTASTNGMLSPQDPLLQIKPSQGAVPPALPFDRFGGAALSASVPPQSSTYRSAQESAPHLLQPQFSLLPASLGGAQVAPQAYGSSVFTGSIERALQRECSVIKHHQRPSSTQSVQSQLSGGTQHSLQGYMAGSGGEVTFQSSAREPATLPCSPVAESTQVSDSRLQQKTSQSTLEQTQAFPSSISSPTFSSPSGTKIKDTISRHNQQTPEATEPHGGSPELRPQSYPSPIQRQSPVVTGQPQQPFTSAQLPSLIPVSSLQHYVTSPTVPNPIQVGSSSQLEKLPSFYRTLTTFSGQSGDLTPTSQSLVYSPVQQQELLSVGRSEEYGNTDQSFSSSHSQTLPTVSYSAQSRGLATVSPSQSFTLGRSLVLTSESLSFPSTGTQNLPPSNPSQEYILMQASSSTKTENTSTPQTQKYLPPVQSPPFSLASNSQALQNNESSTELKLPYSKRKLDTSTFAVSKHDGDEFLVQDLQGLQQASQEPTTQALADCDPGEQNNTGLVNPKGDDRYHSQSVIRSSMQQEDQVMGLTLSESKKDERMMSLNHHKQHVTTGGTNQVTADAKRASPLLQSSHASIPTEEVSKQHSLLQVVPQSQLPLNHQMQAIGGHQQVQNHMVQQTQYIRLPSAQVLLEPSRDLQRILLQQPLFHPGLDTTKVSAQLQQIPVHYLQMDDQAMGSSDSHVQQQVVLPQSSDVLKMGIAETSKSIVQQQHQTPKETFGQTSQHDAKHHFALSSICFPDSVLLGDERNILSNVDDILAATAAACGVTPQDFVKATSSEGEIPSIANAVDSKGHFQFVETRHISPSFSSPHPIAANTHTVAMTQNSAQLNIAIHPMSKGGNLAPQAVGVLNSSVQQELTGSAFSSGQDMGERGMRSVQKSQSTSLVLEEEKGTVAEDGTGGYSNGAFNHCRRSLSNEKTASEDDSQQAGEESMGLTHLLKEKDHAQDPGQMNAKMDQSSLEFSANGCPKKKAKSKGSNKIVGAEENGFPKSGKRTGQGKRQNSRGSETSSPSTSDSCYDGYQQQERMRQKIREVEEKQPEVKTGFIGSFLDFLKSGPKQQFSSPPIRMPNRSRKTASSFKRPCPLPVTSKPQPFPASLTSPEADSVSACKRLDDELKRNLEALPSFSSDEDDSVGKNQDLQKSITSALSALDDPSDKKIHFGVMEKSDSEPITKLEQSHNVPSSGLMTDKQCPVASVGISAPERLKDFPPDQLAKQLNSVAIEGLTDEDLSDSGGEGMYRERDEFVVKIEDIECLKVTLTAGHEPPAIWKVQKALLQKFVPELRNGTRVFSATNSYLGYFGDAKSLYRRVYVKFIDTVNKREYVRVCSRKPRCKPMHSMRGSHAKALLCQMVSPAAATELYTLKPGSNRPPSKPRAKQPKVKAEPPPKKRKKWKEFTPSPAVVSPEAASEDDEFTPPVPFATRFLNTRTMKEAFRSSNIQ
ncbi:hypothetical protein GJAV_G00066570 [Gymnothorax javanicus]|nr:hypothetical protein GJAV_G00066570 [Gymnothorax javanicus]